MSSPGLKRKRESDVDGETSSDDEETVDLFKQYDLLMRSMWEDLTLSDLAKSTVRDASSMGVHNDVADMTIDREEVSEYGAEKTGGAVGAKRRKMDKKKLKREEQKRLKAETIDAAEFKLLRNQGVKLISLLPVQLDYLATSNPRHVLADPEQHAAIRARCEAIAVEGDALRAAPAKFENVERYSRTWRNRVTALPVALGKWSSAHYPPSFSSLAILAIPRASSSPFPTTMLSMQAQPPLQRNLIANQVAKVLTKAERKEIEAWRRARDGRLGVCTKAAERGEASLKKRESIAVLMGREVSAMPARRSRRVARFYAPPVGIGGKARGYGWGYLGSREGSRDEKVE